MRRRCGAYTVAHFHTAPDSPAAARTAADVHCVARNAAKPPPNGDTTRRVTRMPPRRYPRDASASPIAGSSTTSSLNHASAEASIAARGCAVAASQTTHPVSVTATIRPPRLAGDEASNSSRPRPVGSVASNHETTAALTPPAPSYTGWWIMQSSLPKHHRTSITQQLWRAVVGNLPSWWNSGEPRFSLGVSGAIVDHNGHVLILRHAFRRRHPWGLVSGWVNAGEAPTDAMRRELREETSLEGAVGPILAIRGDRRAPSVEVVYLVRVVNGTFRPSAETPEGRWCDLREPPPDGVHPSHRPLFELAARAAGVN